jgi:hypothetical protein
MRPSPLTVAVYALTGNATRETLTKPFQLGLAAIATPLVGPNFRAADYSGSRPEKGYSSYNAVAFTPDILLVDESQRKAFRRLNESESRFLKQLYLQACNSCENWKKMKRQGEFFVDSTMLGARR